MYFFHYIILILLIILTGLMMYQYLLDRRKNFVPKKCLILLSLVLIQGIMMLFPANYLTLIFIDFSCFLGYLLRRNREAFLLSILNILYCSMILHTISWFYYLVYVIYFGIAFKNTKHTFTYLLSIKAFLTSFLYFIYFSQNPLGIASLLFSFLYFYCLLELSYYFMREQDNKIKQDMMIFQVAHEVKNPIAVCKGYLDMLDPSKQEKVNQYIPIVKSEMERALTIMDDFLSLKRLTVEKDIMDLYMLVEDIGKTMESVLENKNISLEIPNCKEELLLNGDYNRLKQVLMNLIKNSCEANAKKIKVEVSNSYEKIELRVIDDGDGIEKKELEKIGTIFYTTKPKGTGIGISMSREIMKRHHGSLSYQSEFGRGTVATLILPSKLVI